MRLTADNEKAGQSTVNRNIKYLLFISGMEQQELATIVELSAAAVSKKLSGQQRWSIGELVTLGDHFGFHPMFMLLDHKDFVQHIANDEELFDVLMRETRCSSARIAA